MKYSIFPRLAQQRVCWSGGARASAHGLRFSYVEGGGGCCLGHLSSVRLSVRDLARPQKSDFLNPGFHSFCSFRRRIGDFWPGKKAASCAATELSRDNFVSPSAQACAPERRFQFMGTLLPI